MFCKFCGFENNDKAVYCQKCGRSQNNVNTENDKYAVTGFVLGLVSILFCWTIILPILGIVFSSKGKNSNNAKLAKSGKILSVIALIPGIICLTILLTITMISFIGHSINQEKIQVDNLSIEEDVQDEKMERAILSWYSGIDTINLNNGQFAIQVDIVLGYTQNDKYVLDKINENIEIINKYLNDYFYKYDYKEYTIENEENIRNGIY